MSSQLTGFKDQPIVIMPLITEVPANLYNIYVTADLAETSQNMSQLER